MDSNQGKIFAVKKKAVFFAKLQRFLKLMMNEKKFLIINNEYSINDYSY